MPYLLTYLKANRTSLVLAALFWVGYVMILSYTPGRGGNYGFPLVVTLNAALFHIGITLYNILYLIPRFLSGRRYGAYIGLLMGMIVVVVPIRGQLERFLYLAYGYKPPSVNTLEYYVGVFATILLLQALFTMLKFSVDWFRAEQVRRDLENQRLKAELNFLKAQINPHFFFNTLNNLYSLAYKQAPETPAVILKLSELMRYILYESKEERVPLVRELEYLQNYIDLQRLRQVQDFEFKFEVNGRPEAWQIEPMLLLPFIENAFKHARRSPAGHFIHIRLQLMEQQLTLQVDNSFVASPGVVVKKNSGIGMSNVGRRLQLLYPGKHERSVHHAEGIYLTTLQLYA